MSAPAEAAPGAAGAGSLGAQAAAALVACIALGQAFIAWEWAIAGFNAPVADWAGVLLVALLLPAWVLGRQPLPRVPAAVAALAFFSVMGVAAAVAPDPRPSVHEWLRKGVFNYVAYAVAPPSCAGCWRRCRSARRRTGSPPGAPRRCAASPGWSSTTRRWRWRWRRSGPW